MTIIDRIKNSNVITADMWVATFVLMSTLPDLLMHNEPRITSTINASIALSLITAISLLCSMCVLFWLLNKCRMIRDYRYLVFRDVCTEKNKSIFNLFLIFGLLPLLYSLYVFGGVEFFIIIALYLLLSVRFEYEEL